MTLCERCESRRRQFPETSPDYLIEELIGEGGMGQVYRALQISRNRRVAIKMMIANSTAGDKAVDYFHREIQALQGMLMPGGKCHRGSSNSTTCSRWRAIFSSSWSMWTARTRSMGAGPAQPLPIARPRGSAGSCSRRCTMLIPGATSTVTSSRPTCW